jgi:hypothetical protein
MGDDSYPFPDFSGIVELGFPGTSVITDPNVIDNPFPLTQIRFRHGQTTFGRDEVTVRI